MLEGSALVEQALEESQQVKVRLAREQIGTLLKIAEIFTDVLNNGGTIYLCGNGGSAADAQHVAAEFVGTSITSGGNGTAEVKDLDKFLAANPCVRFLNRQRGYVRCTITPRSWTSDYRIVENIKALGAPARTLKSFVVEAGEKGVQPA